MSNAKEMHQVVVAFELWRHNRGSRRSPTPQALRKKAVDLLEHCSSSKVITMLRISGSQLKQLRESVKPSQTNHDFTYLHKAKHILNEHLRIELRFCNVTASNFWGEMTQALLVTIIQEAKS